MRRTRSTPVVDHPVALAPDQQQRAGDPLEPEGGAQLGQQPAADRRGSPEPRSTVAMWLVNDATASVLARPGLEKARLE